MKRGKFSLSHTKLLSCDMGALVPLTIMDVLPGDTIQHATTCMVRCAPLLAPVMHRVDVRIHHWFVPLRLLWDDFEDFITGGPAGVSVPTFPTRTFTTGPAVGTLSDYLGVPTGVNNIEVSALPYRAYGLIWNENYRDQDLQTELTVSTAAGADTTTNTTIQNCAWEKDYFTSARPWEQKGPAITIPLGTQAPISGIGNSAAGTSVTNVSVDDAVGGPGTVYAHAYRSQVSADLFLRAASANGQPNAFADLSNASAITVNALREALALQRYEEARARFGSRYVEYLRYLNVRSSDARLQRPEYLGGGSYPVQFSEVLQTAEGTDPVGQMAGHGLGVSRSARYRRFFEEHGYVISVMSVKPKTIYAQGLFRTWNRRTKEDFWQKELQHIGQQPIENKEVYAAHTSPNGTFGYQDRYDEYRRMESSVAGAFRPGQNLDFWNFARSFSSDPALNADFVKCVPSEEPFAVPSENTLYVMARHSVQARRLVAQTGQSYIF